MWVQQISLFGKHHDECVAVMNEAKGWCQGEIYNLKFSFVE